MDNTINGKNVTLVFVDRTISVDAQTVRIRKTTDAQLTVKKIAQDKLPFVSFREISNIIKIVSFITAINNAIENYHLTDRVQFGAIRKSIP